MKEQNITRKNHWTQTKVDNAIKKLIKKYMKETDKHQYN